MKTYTERLNYALKLRDKSQTDVANAIGTKPQAIQHLAKPAPGKKVRGSRHTPAIAGFLRIDAQWLATGEGATPSAYDGSVEPGPDLKGRAPLISWVQAGCWEEIVDRFNPGEAEEWLLVPRSCGPRTFALRVRGASMDNPGGRYSYSDGDIIFVDPDAPYENNSRVIARLEENKEATFKQLIIEGDRKYLRALNPGWPDKTIEVTSECTICGVVIGKWVAE